MAGYKKMNEKKTITIGVGENKKKRKNTLSTPF